MFSQTTEYALRAMACLALTPKELVAASTLADMTKVPGDYLAKVLQQLSAAGFVTGRRGAGGGYQLARPASEILLLDVIRCVGHIERIHTCPLGLPNHGPNLCPLHRRMDEAARVVIESLDGVTLETLTSDPKANRPLCDVEATARLAGITINGSDPAAS